MTDEQKDDIRYLIAYYDAHGYDWTFALEYQVRKYNGSLPHQERWPNRGRHATTANRKPTKARGRDALDK